jgi:hypothetical protein
VWKTRSPTRRKQLVPGYSPGAMPSVERKLKVAPGSCGSIVTPKSRLKSLPYDDHHGNVQPILAL